MKLFAKISLIAVAVVLLNSCKKNDDQLDNLTPFRKDAGQAETIDQTTVNSDMVLQDRVNGVDYIITNNVQVNANLTVQPGVTLMFADGAGLQVTGNGSLTAIGTDKNEIMFTSQAGKRGAWKGITILNSNAKNVLSYCKIEQGGGDNQFGSANVVVGSKENAARVEISNCNITTSKINGILLAEGSQILHFEGNTFATNSAYPVSMNITNVANINDNNTYTGNGKEYIELTGNGNQPIDKEIVIRKTGQPLVVTGRVVSAKGFKVTAGARMYMDNEAEIIIDGFTDGKAYFNAVGTAAQPVTIAAVYNGAGLWNYIKIRSSNPINNIEYCNISGGGAANEGMISVEEKSTITIRNSSIMNSGAAGIYIEKANTAYNNDIVTSNTFSNNADGNLKIGE